MQKQWLGLTDYNNALEVSKTCNSPSITGSENHPVITLGRRSLEISQESRENLPDKFQIAQVDRGGHATLHNPGQLVIYPHLHLPSLNIGVKDYVGKLAQATVEVLTQLGVQARAELNPKLMEPGIYTDQGKIGFIGVRVQKGVTSHGLSLNVHNDLSDFAWIRSCSVWGQPMASLETHGVFIQTETLFDLWCEAFIKSFSLTQKVPFTNVEHVNHMRV